MTKKAKHTPGPWKMDGRSIMAEWENGESVRVATVGWTRWGGCEEATKLNNRMRLESDANTAGTFGGGEIVDQVLG